MIDALRKLHNKINTLISRAVVDSRASDGTYQVLWAADRASADVEHMQPQGLHVAAPSDAQGVLVSPGGNKSASVLLGAQGSVPGGALGAGEGGLHYLGAWKIYMAADGSLALGDKLPSDFVALASKVDLEFNTLKTALGGWTPVALDGGAALKAALATFFGTPAATGSLTVKVTP